MKKTFKYLMSLVAVVMLSFAFASCTNEDNVDFGPVGNWSVRCSSVVAPDKDQAWAGQVMELMNKDICLDQTLADPTPDTKADDEEEEEEKEPLDLTVLKDKSETQAKYYLRYAMESCYQYLNAAANEDFRKSLPDGTVITFTLYRVTAENNLNNSTVSVTVTEDAVIPSDNLEFDLKK